MAKQDAAPDPAPVSADAGESLAQMSTDKPAPLPAEAEHDALMEQMRVMTEEIQRMRGELGAAKAGYAAATAALGPPAVAVYGQAIYDKLVSLQNAHPDLPGHFTGLIKLAKPLGDTSAAAIAGTGDTAAVTAELETVVPAVDRFITRTHGRTVSKPVDFSALAADLEYAQDAASAA